MEESTNREKILKKVRNALIAKTTPLFPNLDMEKSVYANAQLPLEVIFAERFLAQQGQFVLCHGKVELMETVLGICDVHKFSELWCIDRTISAFFDEFEFPHQSVFDNVTDTDVEVAVVPCECLIARTGSIVFSPTILSDSQLLAIARNCIVIAHLNQLTPDFNEAMAYLKERNDNRTPSSLFIINGRITLNIASRAENLERQQEIIVILILPE
jgi:L-lactate dehydrogenase complex protein LldG